MSGDEREARRAHRLGTWTGGVVASFQELADRDLAFWMSATASERVRGVTALIDEMRALEGEHGSRPRLQRSVGGVRSR